MNAESKITLAGIWRGAVALIVAAGVISSPLTAARAADEPRTFPETGKTVSGRFLEYWEGNGGLAQQGFPISEEMQETSDVDGNTYTVQYFERAVFELHPENPTPYDVLLSLLGASNYNEKYSGNAPDQVPNTDNPVTFPETGKTVGGVFRTYWETHGGLAQQGFPISDEFQELDKDGNLRSVQYFERAVFEYHEEFAGTESEVLLSLLGAFFYAQKYAQGGTPPPSGGGPGGSLTIVAVGDSLTEGQGDMPEGGGYPSRLLKSVRTIRPDAQMTNLGVSGYTSQQMVEEEVPVAVNAKPDIALVWIGGNNLWNNGGPETEASDLNIFGTDIDTTLRSLTATGAKTFIALVYDQTKSPYATSPNGAALDPAGVAHMQHLVTEFNKIITAKAKQYEATTVDIYSNTNIFVDPATLAEDDAHPNAAGYDLLAQIWFEAIRSVLE